MRGNMMDLESTYSDRSIHHEWESVYRDNPKQDRMNEQIMKRLFRILKPSSDALFLDAGCGTGDHTARIALNGARCVGIDISESILEDARRRIARQGLHGRASFQQEKLEGLSFPDDSFDFVHCRGVLMHIPDWERALAELCRVLKPGGRLAIIESNLSALEVQIVKLVRSLTRRQSKLVETPGGLEFWATRDGNPFVFRTANIPFMINKLKTLNMRVVDRFATEFWDLNRFPRGLIRNGIIGFNRAWFSLHLPASWSVGNALIAEKLPPPHEVLRTARQDHLDPEPLPAHT
jgi:ubiquinone/menaquinone biosynthesis C-methylase UbiE